MTIELALGIVGTITGLTSLSILIWKTMQEKPIIKISDALLSLERKAEDKVVGSLSFNIDNLGDRPTTVTRVNVILGDHVEVIEGLRSISSHSSIRYPEKTDSELKLFTRYKEIRDLKIIVIHTHGTLEKIYKLPQISEWDKYALWKGGPLLLQP
jgi:hypothetical protein